MTEHTPRGALPAKNVRAQALGNAVDSTGPRPVINADLGPALAAARTARGLSARALAAAIGAAPSTVTRLERGERRISPAMLASLAAALSPDDPEQLRSVLTRAAGPLLVPDTPGGVRRRERRMERATTRAQRERNRRINMEHRTRIAMARRAAELTATAYAMFDSPDAIATAAGLDRIDALLDESRRLQDAAGPVSAAIYSRLLVANAKIAGRSMTMAKTGRAPTPRRRPALPPPPRPLVEPPRDAPWPVVDRYLKEKARRELGVEYD